MSSTELRSRRGTYGVDGDFRLIPAAWQLAIVSTIFAALMIFTVLSATAGRPILALVLGLIAAWLLMTVVFYGHTTRVGKFQVWADILTGLQLRGDEDLLDLGCGRGAVLLAAARLLTTGHATGFDLWRADQTGNSAGATLRNAGAEGVTERVSVRNGDMRHLPFDDQSFDVIVSSFAIHNISDPAGRKQAIDEAARVLRPGGRILIADLEATKTYVARFQELGLDVRRRNLGWRVWWGGPWFPTRLVTAASRE